MNQKHNKYNINNEFDFSHEINEKVIIFVGAYGSGKSEIALNFALSIANKVTDKKIALADLDIINPYFRSSDAKNKLKEFNVKLICSKFANTNAEVPAIPDEIFSIFDNDKMFGVLDIGGEDMGARVVASIKNKIVEVPHKIYMVINTNRPYTNTKEKIIKMTEELAKACSLPIDGYINNTNLLEYTEIADLVESNKLINEVSKINNIPLLFCSGLDEVYPAEWGNTSMDGVSFFRISRNILYFEAN